MELLIEAVFSLVIEGTIGLSKSKKVPMPIRILCAVFLLLVITAAILLIGFVGVSILKEKLWGGIAILLFDALLAALFIYRFIKIVRHRAA